MGFLKGLFPREEKREDISFKKLHRHMNLQKEWINYLHENTKKLHEHTRMLNESHNEHRKEVSKNIENIKQWIEYLYKNHLKLEEDMEDMENNIKGIIKKDLEKYHYELILYFENLITDRLNHNKLKKEILADVEYMIDERNIKETESLVLNESSPAYDKEDLSASERDLLNFLFNANNPMTYEDIALKTNKSINSIRVYMNSLKSKKDIIEEFRKPDGVKIFSVKNKEKIKTLYNLN